MTDLTISDRMLGIMTQPTVRRLAELHPDRAVRFVIPPDAVSREIEDIQTALLRGRYRKAEPLYDESFHTLAMDVLVHPIHCEMERLNIHGQLDSWLAIDDEGALAIEGVIVGATARDALAAKLRFG